MDADIGYSAMRCTYSDNACAVSLLSNFYETGPILLFYLLEHATSLSSGSRGQWIEQLLCL